MKAPHFVVALDLPVSVSAKITFARHFAETVAANPSGYFPNPTPAPAAMLADIEALAAAEATAQSHARGAAEARDLRLAVVLNDVHALVAYVEAVANARPSEARAIIEAASLKVKAHGAHSKPPLSAEMHEGVVLLRAHSAGPHAAYEWAISSDGGKTWTALPVTSVASTTVTGLTTGSTYHFRVRATVHHTAGEWSQPVSLLVH